MFFHNSCYFLEGHSVSDSIKKFNNCGHFLFMRMALMK